MSQAIAIPNTFLFLRERYEPVSKDSEDVQKDWASRKNYVQASASDWGPLVDGALRCIRDECSSTNWDGEDGKPVSRRTIELTRKIVEAIFASLPLSTPPPDLVPESDGEISVNWVLDAKRMFALSIGEHEKLNFAGQFGDKGALHGWTPVDETGDGSLEGSVAEMAKKVALLYSKPEQRRIA